MRAILKPTLAETWECVIDCQRPYGNGAPQQVLPEQQRDALQALYESSVSYAVTSPSGREVVANVIRVGDMETRIGANGTVNYFIRVRLRERPA